MSDLETLRRLEAMEKRLANLETIERGGGGGARVFNSAAISINNTTVTALTFDSEVYDVGAYHSGSSGDFTVPAAGMYVIGACAAFASNATGFRLLRINAGGGVVVTDTQPAVNGDRTILAIVTTVQLAAGGVVSAEVYQTSGGALNVDAVSAYSPYMWIARVA